MGFHSTATFEGIISQILFVYVFVYICLSQMLSDIFQDNC